MSSFNENDRYALNSHTFELHYPQGQETDAYFVVKQNNQEVERYNITDENCGLMYDDGDVVVGLASFDQAPNDINMDFGLWPIRSTFTIGPTSDAMIGGIGIEDLRDISFHGIVNTHIFYIGIEPINLRLDTDTGYIVAEIRDLATKALTEDAWYQVIPEER